MKILLANTNHWSEHWQGAEVYLENLSRALRKKDLQVNLVSQTGLYDEDTKCGHSLGRSWMTVSGASVEAWRALLEKHQPDVVHLVNASALGVSLIHAASDLGMGIALTIVDSWWECPKGNLRTATASICEGNKSATECARCIVATQTSMQLPGPICRVLTTARAHSLRDIHAFKDWYNRHRILQSALSKVQKLVFISRDKMTSIRRAYQLDEDCLVFLPVPVSVDTSQRYQLSYSSEGSAALRVGFAGSLSEDKGFFHLLEALREVTESRPVELHVAGEFPNALSNKRFGQIRLEYPVILRGQIDHREMLQFYLGVDLLVLPSLCVENQPQVLLEALALGLPVIAGDVPGVRELVDDGRTYTAGDSAALADHILSWASRPHLEPPQKTAESWETLADGMYCLYESIASNRRYTE